ncbi:MAG: cob(I)yrinic acid a,c-diamide adenosyltransferase [Ignavibacteria bacterium]|nr:cob(I)yrinic acid a,c-diamide adenosyltransferase [Ignavibacteria bacterium]
MDIKNKNNVNSIHIYYGDGKGKTTAALGLALRAIGAGKRITIIQFDKGGSDEFYSERRIINFLKDKGFKINLYSTGNFRIDKKRRFRFENINSDYEEALSGLKLTKDLISKGKQDILILDEIISAVYTKLLSKKQVEEIIELYNKNRNFELILTGRKIWKKLKDSADLITQMKKIKHYFDKGIIAKKGIEY